WECRAARGRGRAPPVEPARRAGSVGGRAGDRELEVALLFPVLLELARAAVARLHGPLDVRRRLELALQEEALQGVVREVDDQCALHVDLHGAVAGGLRALAAFTAAAPAAAHSHRAHPERAGDSELL